MSPADDARMSDVPAPETLQTIAAKIDALNKSKPATRKGVYLRKVAVSSTMGVGVRVDTQSIAAPATA